jgi:hypothetical protein
MKESSIGRHIIPASAVAALALVLLQFGAIRLAPSALVVRIVVPATIAGVPLVLWPHRRRIGVWVMFVGLAANLAVVLANGGLMPIDRSTVVAAVGTERAANYADGAWMSGSKDVLVGVGSGRAVALGDSIVVPARGRGIVASPGDVVILAGVLVLAAEASIGWQRDERRRRRQRESAPPSGARGSATTPQ